MKRFTTILSLLLFQISGNTQTFCLNFEQVTKTATEFIVDLQIAGSGTIGLGSCNFQFTYNGLGMSNPTLISSAISTPTYQVPSLTSPAPNTLSFNIELNFAPGFSVGTSFTDFARIKFDIVDQNETSNLQWSYNGGTTATVVFLDDESTQIFATGSGITCLMPLAAPLPVRLTHFQARAQGIDAVLDWRSEQEIAFSHYEIERSTDERNWLYLTKIQGKGESNSTLNYDYTDVNALLNAPGNNLYYRLKMVDVDGSFAYSAIRSVQAKGETTTFVQVYPNPVKGQLFIELPPDTPLLNTSLINATGQVVRQWQHQGTTVLDTHSLPAGIYTLRSLHHQDVWWVGRVVVE